MTRQTGPDRSPTHTEIQTLGNRIGQLNSDKPKSEERNHQERKLHPFCCSASSSSFSSSSPPSFPLLRLDATASPSHFALRRTSCPPVDIVSTGTWTSYLTSLKWHKCKKNKEIKAFFTFFSPLQFYHISFDNTSNKTP